MLALVLVLAHVLVLVLVRVLVRSPSRGTAAAMRDGYG